MLKEGKGSVVKMSMDDDNLLLFIEKVDRRPPRCGFDELGVYKLRRLFVDDAILLNGLRVPTVFNNLLVNLTS